MEIIQQEINTHKNKMMNLINNLMNTQLINEEISINNEIKKESEFLFSLLTIKQDKQNTLNIQNNINNNININPFSFQQKPFINPLNININPIQQNIFHNNFNCNGNNDVNNIKINIRFYHFTGKNTILTCDINEKFADVVQKYREKSNDYKEDFFSWNGQKLSPFSTMTLAEIGIKMNNTITVFDVRNLNDTVFDVSNLNDTQ